MAVNNIFAQGMEAMDASYNRQRGYAQDRAKIQAGRSLAQGAPTEAQSTLNSAGMLDDARTIQQDQVAAEGRSREQHTADVATKAKGLIELATNLKTIPPGQRAAALRQSAPILQQIGVDPTPFMQLDEQHLDDANLDVFTGQVAKQYQFLSLGNGGIARGNPQTGELSTMIEPEYEQKYATVPEGGKLVPIPRGQASAGAPQAPAADQAASAPQAAPTQGGGPRNLRNQNPGNIEDGPFAQSLPGYAGSDGRFAKFSDMGSGTQAQVALLGSYGKRGINTVEGIINRWAPASDGNDTAAYARFVAGKIGVQPGQTLDMSDPATLSDVASAIQQFEGGGQSASGKPAQVAQNGDPSGTIYGAPKPVEQWVDLPGGGQRNVATNETKNVPNPKPGKLSATALGQQNEHLGSLQTSSAINTRLARVTKMLDDGSLDLGPAKNVFATAQNAIGFSSPQSANYASFRADLEKLRNDSLKLNKGVQTEGDATRAWNELVANLNDPRVVRQRLQEIEAYNRQAISFHRDMVDQIRDDSGMKPIDTSKFEAKPLDIGGSASPVAPAAGGGGAITAARAAIAKGAPRAAVIQRLRQNGIDPKGL